MHWYYKLLVLRFVPSVAYMLLVELVSAGSFLRVSRDIFVLLFIHPPLVPSAAHLFLVEPVSAGSSLPVSRDALLLVITSPSSRAFRGTLAYG